MEKPAAEPGAKSKDALVLVLAALFVCTMLVASFWLAIDYHINPLWIFAAFHSFVLVALFVDDFRSQLNKPYFLLFLATWAMFHGLLVSTLMRWMSLIKMLPILAVEVVVGYLLADFIFGIRPKLKE